MYRKKNQRAELLMVRIVSRKYIYRELSTLNLFITVNLLVAMPQIALGRNDIAYQLL